MSRRISLLLIVFVSFASALPNVLIVCPLHPQASNHLPTFTKLLLSFDSPPRHQLGIVYYYDGPSRESETAREASSSVTTLLNAGFKLGEVIFGPADILQLPNRVHKHTPALQWMRRARIARSRNNLVDSSLSLIESRRFPAEYYLWLDVDVVSAPSDLVTLMYEADGDIVAAHVVMNKNGMTYDRNTWKQLSGLEPKCNPSEELLLEGGPTHETHGRLHLDWFRERGDVKVEVDGVGGAALLVRTSVHAHPDVSFPETPFRCLIETEGFGILARAVLGPQVRIFGLPQVEVVHPYPNSASRLKEELASPKSIEGKWKRTSCSCSTTRGCNELANEYVIAATGMQLAMSPVTTQSQSGDFNGNMTSSGSIVLEKRSENGVVLCIGMISSNQHHITLHCTATNLLCDSVVFSKDEWASESIALTVSVPVTAVVALFSVLFIKYRKKHRYREYGQDGDKSSYRILEESEMQSTTADYHRIIEPEDAAITSSKSNQHEHESLNSYLGLYHAFYSLIFFVAPSVMAALASSNGPIATAMNVAVAAAEVVVPLFGASIHCFVKPLTPGLLNLIFGFGNRLIDFMAIIASIVTIVDLITTLELSIVGLVGTILLLMSAIGDIVLQRIKAWPNQQHIHRFQFVFGGVYVARFLLANEDGVICDRAWSIAGQGGRVGGL